MKTVKSISTRWGTGAVVRRGDPCLCADDQPRPSAADSLRPTESLRPDERAWATLRPVCQPTYHRTGTLWEGRFRSCLVEAETYFLACQRYVELNPVRAGMGPDPAAYPWSSFSANAGAQPDPVITPHPLYLALGPTPRDEGNRVSGAVYRGARSGLGRFPPGVYPWRLRARQRPLPETDRRPGWTPHLERLAGPAGKTGCRSGAASTAALAV